MSNEATLFPMPEHSSPFATRCAELGIIIARPEIYQVALAVVTTPFIAKRGLIFAEGTDAKEAAFNLCEGIGIEFEAIPKA